MARENILKDKSFSFSVQIIGICKELQAEKEYVLSKQLLRSSTAIGALIREAEFAQSTADFINKLSIALKEANETVYWIELLTETKYLDLDKGFITKKVALELVSLLVASIKTLKLKTNEVKTKN